MNNFLLISLLILIVLYNFYKSCKEGMNDDGIQSDLFMKAKEEPTMMNETQKQKLSGVTSSLWMKVKEDKKNKGEDPPNLQEEEGVKQFLEALDTPGVDVPGDTSTDFQKLIDKGPVSRGPPLQYNDDMWNAGVMDQVRMVQKVRVVHGFHPQIPPQKN